MVSSLRIPRKSRNNMLTVVLSIVALTMLCSTTGVVEASNRFNLAAATTSSSSRHNNRQQAPPRGGSSSTTPDLGGSSGSAVPIRVAYQGVPGAYSEKSLRELLGEQVIAIGRPSFEDCFRAVTSMECDYACLPIENSLGGSIHENYDLMLRYDLSVVAEHEFRINHCLLAQPGVKREDIKYAISHPQALAQCDNYLRSLGITPISVYDTAGSAKMIAEGAKLPPNCTPQNTASIASELAAKIYGLNCLNKAIEDDDSNFTRFLLLSRKDVVGHITKKMPAKTSVVFTLPDRPAALYKALACFSLRDIDMSKIESRPTSASLLNYLKFKSQKMGKKSQNIADPRFRYCFYLDFLANQLDENAQNALAHLREQAVFVRILGSYPQKSRLVGPVAQDVEGLKRVTMNQNELSIMSLPSDSEETKPLNIGIVGFDAFGQLLARELAKKNRVSCLDIKSDHSADAKKLGVEYFSNFEMTKFLSELDVVVLAVPLIDFESAVESLPISDLKGKLVVDTCVLNTHPKTVMLQAFGNHPEIDILSSHPMVGMASLTGSDRNDPYAGTTPWDGRPMIYEKVRISNMARCERFLKIFERARCQLVEMTAEEHDSSIADAEFVTHLTGRLLLDKQLLPPSPVSSREYAALCDVADVTTGDSFDLFYGMFKYNDRARDYLTKMRDNLGTLERQLAAKEAYLTASMETKSNDRQRLVAETKLLLQEIAKDGGLFGVDNRNGSPKEKAVDPPSAKPTAKK